MNLKEMSDEELINQASGFSCGCDKCFARVEPPRRELLSRLERGRKAIEEMARVKRLCDIIVNSDPSRKIKGEIESMAFELSTSLNLLLKETTDGN